MRKFNFFYVFLYLLPKNFISNMWGKLVSIQLPKFLAININKFLVKKFNIDMDEALEPIENYDSFQSLFIRKLKRNIRPIDANANILISPCDGFLVDAGVIKEGKIIQNIKDRFYLVKDLLKDQKKALMFEGGYYFTIYLAPKDYHRFHVSLNSEIIDTKHIPGFLWPVNEWGVKNIDNLFCVNERTITYFKEENSQMCFANVAIGACLVGKIKLFYEDLPNKSPLFLRKGDELGSFMFGSTIVLLFEPGLVKDIIIQPKNHLKMGQPLAKI